MMSRLWKDSLFSARAQRFVLLKNM
jgi:hypothetical protein